MSESDCEVLLLAASWGMPGELRFYCDGHPDAYTVGCLIGDRRSQYDIWRPNPIDDAQVFEGRSFVYVGAELPLLGVAFERVEGPIEVVYAEQGLPLSTWQVWRCWHLKSFQPFDRLSVKARY